MHGIAAGWFLCLHPDSLALFPSSILVHDSNAGPHSPRGRVRRPAEAPLDKTTEALARFASSLRFENLGAGTVKAAKRHILDTVACALGGYRSEPADIARRLARANGGSPGARLIGDGISTSLQMAAFANAVMVRYLDANDTFISRGSGHPSDVFAAVLAAAEASNASGRQLIAGIVRRTKFSVRLPIRSGFAIGAGTRAYSWHLRSRQAPVSSMV